MTEPQPWPTAQFLVTLHHPPAWQPTEQLLEAVISDKWGLFCNTTVEPLPTEPGRHALPLRHGRGITVVNYNPANPYGHVEVVQEDGTSRPVEPCEIIQMPMEEN